MIRRAMKARDKYIRRCEKKTRKLEALARRPKPKRMIELVNERRKARLLLERGEGDVTNAREGATMVEVGKGPKPRKAVENVAADGKVMVRILKYVRIPVHSQILLRPLKALHTLQDFWHPVPRRKGIPRHLLRGLQAKEEAMLGQGLSQPTRCDWRTHQC